MDRQVEPPIRSGSMGPNAQRVSALDTRCASPYLPISLISPPRRTPYRSQRTRMRSV